MEVAYYNLAGGINQALTKTELGIDTKKFAGQMQKTLKYFKTEELSNKKAILYFWK